MKKLQTYRYNLSLDLQPSGNIYSAQHAKCYGICNKDMIGWGDGIKQSFVMQLTCSEHIIKKNHFIDFTINVDQAKELVKSLNSFIRQCEKENVQQ